jgi:uncharacterized membrane protein YcaP (DUF421 family)
MLVVSWAGIRILGKKSIAQMTGYELAGVLLMTTAAAEPLVYKIQSKATVGVFTIVIATLVIGKVALSRRFYNLDYKPSIIIANGKIDKEELSKNKMNLPFLLSLLRIQGYSKVSDVEFAIIEPNGNLSVIPKSQNRPVTPQDLKIDTQYEGLALPLVIDGEIQYNNLKYAKLNTDWLHTEIQKAGVKKVEEIFLAEIDTSGQLYVETYKSIGSEKPPIF